MVDSKSRNAVCLRDVNKSYGEQAVLDNLSMAIFKGSIYALLGASGCGKSTILNIIAGSKKTDGGEIRVLGRLPGERPKSVGYMPQDVALVNEFTIKDMLQHFGCIYGMNDRAIEKRIAFLSQLLNLPAVDSSIGEISGGEKRRVSLAVALIHNPSVLLLDEPTVGLDPEIRHQIWQYLIELARDGKAILITTHYIEEARRAHAIGLMRNGKILIEGAPKALMSRHNCENIEDIFLLLSKKQDDGSLKCGPQKMQYKESDSDDDTRSNLVFHARALLTKNMYKFTRNKVSLTFYFILPAFLSYIFLVSIGGNFVRSIGIVNHELGEFKNCSALEASNLMFARRINEQHCELRGMSCKFLSQFSSDYIKMIYMKSAEEARQAVRQGKIMMYIEFHQNFSEKLELSRESFDMSDDEITQQEISIYADNTDYQGKLFLDKNIYAAYGKFSNSIEKECGFPAGMGNLPLRFAPPVYSARDTLTEFIAPGFMISISMVLTFIYSAMTIVTERTDGIWDRTLVAGVTKAEIMFWHFAMVAVLNAFQICEMGFLTFFIFDMECKGSFVVAMTIIICQGVCGTALGNQSNHQTGRANGQIVLLSNAYQRPLEVLPKGRRPWQRNLGMALSIISTNMTDCMQNSAGICLPLFLLSGALWPIEGMPKIMQTIAYCFIPSTLSVEALRNVVHRGWGFGNFHVDKAMYSSFFWCTIILMTNVLVLKYERR